LSAAAGGIRGSDDGGRLAQPRGAPPRDHVAPSRARTAARAPTTTVWAAEVGSTQASLAPATATATSAWTAARSSVLMTAGAAAAAS
jgi:hypothetical protein